MNRTTIGFFLCLTLAARSTSANVITFDEFGSTRAIPTPVPNGYAGLQWTNFNVKSAGDITDPQHTLGYGHSVVSGTDIVYNVSAQPATITKPTSSGPGFDLLSVYLTAAWNDGLVVKVQATRKSKIVYTATATVDTTGPTHVLLDFFNIDSVTFSSSGGMPHDPTNPTPFYHFAMDNVEVQSPSKTPEPATAAWLAGTCLLGLIRRRTNS